MDKQSCLGCKFFKVDVAIADWSDFTPGYSYSLSCGRGVWLFDPYEASTEGLRLIMSSSILCKEWVWYKEGL